MALRGIAGQGKAKKSKALAKAWLRKAKAMHGSV